MPEANVLLSESEVRTVYAVFTALESHFKYEELNSFIGNVTIAEMHQLIPALRAFIGLTDNHTEEE